MPSNAPHRARLGVLPGKALRGASVGVRWVRAPSVPCRGIRTERELYEEMAVGVGSRGSNVNGGVRPLSPFHAARATAAYGRPGRGPPAHPAKPRAPCGDVLVRIPPELPPVPFDPYPDLPVYRLPDGSWLVDDSTVQFPPPRQTMTRRRRPQPAHPAQPGQPAAFGLAHAQPDQWSRPTRPDQFAPAEQPQPAATARSRLGSDQWHLLVAGRDQLAPIAAEPLPGLRCLCPERWLLLGG